MTKKIHSVVCSRELIEPQSIKNTKIPYIKRQPPNKDSYREKGIKKPTHWQRATCAISRDRTCDN